MVKSHLLEELRVEAAKMGGSQRDVMSDSNPLLNHQPQPSKDSKNAYEFIWVNGDSILPKTMESYWGVASGGAFLRMVKLEY